MIKESKKPNLQAPRHRPKTVGRINKELVSKLRSSVPSAKSLTDTEIKNIVLSFNLLVYKTVIEHRDGVDLPENLGNIFIGSCLPKIKKNVDFKKSTDCAQVIGHRNFESDNFLAKIFYTNHETKHRFKNNELWGFKGCRNFTRMVGKVYPENWKRYIQIDHSLKISKLFRKNSYRMDMAKRNDDSISNYDEFDMD